MIVRFDARLLTLGLMIVSALVVVGVAWLALSLLFSLAQYVPNLP